VIGSNQSPGDVVAPPPAEPSPVPTTEVVPLPAVTPSPVARVPRVNVVRRVLEWFWRGRAMKALRAEARIGSPRASELMRRAWLAVELAEHALRPVPRLLTGPADAPARELARQGLYWGLLAEREIRLSREAPAGTAPVGLTEPASLPDLWVSAEQALLLAAAGGDGALYALHTALKVDGFAEFAELSSEEQARQARDLLAFCRTLLVAIEAPRVRLDKLITQRLVRSGGGVLLCIGLVVAGLAFRSWSERERDLARDRPYKASSVYPSVGCKSPDQDCPESPFFFFHTADDDRPWIEIDLGAKKRFTAFRIVNREDCCADRAVPLAVEVSTDKKTWHEIARRTDTFNTWYASVTPVSARYVRAIALRKTTLHFHRFSILR